MENNQAEIKRLKKLLQKQMEENIHLIETALALNMKLAEALSEKLFINKEKLKGLVTKRGDNL